MIKSISSDFIIRNENISQNFYKKKYRKTFSLYDKHIKNNEEINKKIEDEYHSSNYENQLFLNTNSLDFNRLNKIRNEEFTKIKREDFDSSTFKSSVSYFNIPNIKFFHSYQKSYLNFNKLSKIKNNQDNIFVSQDDLYVHLNELKFDLKNFDDNKIDKKNYFILTRTIICLFQIFQIQK